MERRVRSWLGLLAGLVALTGCVDRRFVITTDPPGAIVYDEKNEPIGASPADKQFTYYGKYRFTLVHDGYETMVVEQPVAAPWYEWLGFDFFSEIVLPLNLRDVRHFHYTMQPLQIVPAEAVMNRAEQLRAKGKTIGTPLPPRFPQPATPTQPATLPSPPAISGPQPRTSPELPGVAGPR